MEKSADPARLQEIATVADLEAAFAFIKREATRLNTVYRKQADQLKTLSTAIEGLKAFKGMLEEETKKFGESTRTEVEALKEHIHTLHTAKDEASNTIETLKESLANAAKF